MAKHWQKIDEDTNNELSYVFPEPSKISVGTMTEQPTLSVVLATLKMIMVTVKARFRI